MHSLTSIIIVVVFITVLLTGLGLLAQQATPTTSPSPLLTPMAGGESFYSPTYKIGFTYPPTYFLSERETGTPEAPQHAIILVEDTPENRAVFEGRATEPREGPTAITIDVYENPEQLTPEAWIRASTTWALSDQQLQPVTVAGKEALAYTWSGLYEGASTVLTDEQRAYVLSVTWLTLADPIIPVYENLLASLHFGAPN